MLSNSVIAVFLSALALTSAAPYPQGTATIDTRQTETYAAPRETRTVVAGRGGLRFDPENIVAPIGSIIEFHFTPLNHSVVESSFERPCQPKDAASFYSGFFPVPRSPDGGVTQSAEVFQIEVKNDQPIWFYCAQNTGRHCQSGMVGVVNQKFDGDKTLAKHKQLAAQVSGDSGVQPWIQGGERKANPNPLSGF
jgi:plastocyanin